MMQRLEKPVLGKMDSMGLQMGSQAQVVEKFNVTHFVGVSYNQTQR